MDIIVEQVPRITVECQALKTFKTQWDKARVTCFNFEGAPALRRELEWITSKSSLLPKFLCKLVLLSHPLLGIFS